MMIESGASATVICWMNSGSLRFAFNPLMRICRALKVAVRTEVSQRSVSDWIAVPGVKGLGLHLRWAEVVITEGDSEGLGEDAITGRGCLTVEATVNGLSCSC